MRFLRQSQSSIHDNAALILAQGIPCHQTPETVDLSSIRDIAETGWQKIVAVLSSPKSSLKKVLLTGNQGITDTVLLSLGEVLCSNNTLDLRTCEAANPAGWVSLL